MTRNGSPSSRTHGPELGRRDRTRGGSAAKRSRRRVVQWIGALALAAVVAASLGVARDGPDIEPSAAPDRGDSGGAGAVASPELVREEQIERALGSSQWPTLSPPVSGLGTDALVPEWVDEGCLAFEDGRPLDDPAEFVQRCAYGGEPGGRTVVVVGDSHAISWVPALRESLGDSWRVHVLAADECPFFGGPTEVGGSDPQCQAFVGLSASVVADLHADLLIASSAAGPASADDVRVAAAHALDAYAGLADVVITVLPPPGGPDLTECRTATSVPADCASYPDPSSVEPLRDAAELADVDAIDPEPWFCLETFCPSFIDGITVYADGTHLTERASRATGPVLVAVIKDRLLMGGHDALAAELG